MVRYAGATLSWGCLYQILDVLKEMVLGDL